MRISNKYIKVTLFVASLFLLFSLTGCMPSKIQQRIDETEKENADIKEKNQEEVQRLEDQELSDEQKKILSSLPKNTAEEALFKNDLDLRKELDIEVPNEQSSFKQPEEFAQYISYLFFAYHKGEMKPEEFLNKVHPHLHENYLNMLPNERDNQIEAFNALQKFFADQLSSPISSYSITNLDFQERAGEAMFYRKYELSNKENIYYVTILKIENDVWKLFDDSPAPPYTITPNIEEKFNNN